MLESVHNSVLIVVVSFTVLFVMDIICREATSTYSFPSVCVCVCVCGMIDVQYKWHRFKVYNVIRCHFVYRCLWRQSSPPSRWWTCHHLRRFLVSFRTPASQPSPSGLPRKALICFLSLTDSLWFLGILYNRIIQYELFSVLLLSLISIMRIQSVFPYIKSSLLFPTHLCCIASIRTYSLSVHRCVDICFVASLRLLQKHSFLISYSFKIYFYVYDPFCVNFCMWCEIYINIYFIFFVHLVTWLFPDHVLKAYVF